MSPRPSSTVAPRLGVPRPGAKAGLIEDLTVINDAGRRSLARHDRLAAERLMEPRRAGWPVHAGARGSERRTERI